jgi:hypothetical protein
MTATAAIAFTHYRLVRRNAPPEGSAYFKRFDTRDLSGAAPLLVSVCTGFLAIRAVLFTFLSASFGAFQASETIAINTGALVLFMAARVRNNPEVKWIYDLFRVKGVPVVLSVLSFMVAAAAGSWVLGKWPRQDNNLVADQIDRS